MSGHEAAARLFGSQAQPDHQSSCRSRDSKLLLAGRVQIQLGWAARPVDVDDFSFAERTTKPWSKGASLREAGIKVEVVILATSEDRNEAFKAVKAGCLGVVMKNTASAIVVEIVRSVYTRKVLGLSTMAADMDTTGGQSIATKREREIIALLAQGYKDREIADRLVISPQTVKNHLQSIYEKYGVSGRLELMAYALYKGLHRLDSEQQQH